MSGAGCPAATQLQWATQPSPRAHGSQLAFQAEVRRLTEIRRKSVGRKAESAARASGASKDSEHEARPLAAAAPYMKVVQGVAPTAWEQNLPRLSESSIFMTLAFL